MTLADFLSSGNLKDLLHDQNILKETKFEGIINSLLPLALIPNANDQKTILEYLETDQASFEKARYIWKFLNGIRLLPNKGLDNIQLLYPGIVIRSNQALTYMAASGIGGIVGYYFELLNLNGLQKLADTFFAFFCLLDFLAEYLHNDKRKALPSDFVGNVLPTTKTFELAPGVTGNINVDITMDVPFDSNSSKAFLITWGGRSVPVFFSVTVTFLILKLIGDAMIKKQTIEGQKLILSRARGGPNLEDPMSDLAKMANEVLSLASGNAELESKKQAQAQKIKEKITKLGEKDDDKELIEMVDKYVNQFYTEKVLEFEDKKKLHRSTVKQDEDHHNKTHLKLISHFFNTLEVNDLF